MKVTFYGTRGSVPICDRDFQEFGGNTSCVLVEFESGEVMILDAGTGIRNLGKDLIIKRHQQDNIYILFSHFHHDHIQGFPFFAPAYHRKRTFTLYGYGQEHGKALETILGTPMQGEYFPVPLTEMGAKLSFLQPAHLVGQVSHIKVTALKHEHPGGAYSYRIEENGKVLVYCTDIEHGIRINQAVVELAQKADLLIHEGQYTPDELVERVGWGHSSWKQAIEVAQQAQVKKLAITHHDPEHNDKFLESIETQCQKYFSNSFLAREKMVVDL